MPCAKWRGWVGHSATGGLHAQRTELAAHCAMNALFLALSGDDRNVIVAVAAAIAVISVRKRLEQARGESGGAMSVEWS